MVERQSGTIMKLVKAILLYARLSKKFLHYSAKYAQCIHDIIPVKDLCDENGLPTTPRFMFPRSKPNVKHFEVFGCPTVFENYDVSESGKSTISKYT